MEVNELYKRTHQPINAGENSTQRDGNCSRCICRVRLLSLPIRKTVLRILVFILE